jgi:branched-chain amino acid transport system permease protein
LDSSQLVVQAIINGFALGWLYVLVALGLTLIVSIMGILQFAHGEIYMLGAYVVYFICASTGISIYYAMVISMLAMALFGVLIERILFRPIMGKMLNAIVVSLGLTLILTSAASVFFGLQQRSLPKLASGYFEIHNFVVTQERAVSIVFAIILLLLLYLFLKKTKQGQAMVASAMNPEGALLRGINPNLMSSMSMAIACALAGAAGTLAGSIVQVTPFMGQQPLLKGLVIVVLGGMGSLPGAVLGGMILGLADGIIPVIWGPEAAAIAPLIIVVIIILVRPQGFFGHD